MFLTFNSDVFCPHLDKTQRERERERERERRTHTQTHTHTHIERTTAEFAKYIINRI
jgi:hypothetical protein